MNKKVVDMDSAVVGSMAVFGTVSSGINKTVVACEILQSSLIYVYFQLAHLFLN